MAKFYDPETGASGSSRFAGVFNRAKQRVAQLGIISGESKQTVQVFRDPRLDQLDAYYECRQYDQLMSWDQATSQEGDYIAVRNRKPRINFALAKVLVDRVAAKLVGRTLYPAFSVEDDPDTTEYLRFVQKAAEMQPRIVPIVKKMLNSGSSFARFQVVEGQLKLSCYNSKFCYPEFSPTGDLISLRVQYVFEDPKEKDERGSPIKKWYRLDLGQMADVLFDNPRYSPETPPQFQPVETAAHGLGFVQGEWFRTEEDEHTPDGPSLIEDIFELIDELNYSLSQSSQAVSYNQEPMLTLKGMDVDELDKIIRSSTKALNVGREGEAKFLESTMKGVEAANVLRDRVKAKITDVVRVVMLDPEKIVGSAQSAKAMEVLHGPLIELVDELRGPLEKCMKSLLLKMSMAILQLNAQGLETEIVIPKGFAPTSLDVTCSWPPVFPLTIEDLAQKATVATAVTGANVISRETATRWLAKDFGVEDVEEELSKIKTQPVMNPFGSFGSGP